MYQRQILGCFDAAGVVRLACGDKDACRWLCDTAHDGQMIAETERFSGAPARHKCLARHDVANGLHAEGGNGKMAVVVGGELTLRESGG